MSGDDDTGTARKGVADWHAEDITSNNLKRQRNQSRAKKRKKPRIRSFEQERSAMAGVSVFKSRMANAGPRL